MKKILNIAHAGARSLAPENTLAAAQKALESGAHIWETDIAVTADGELILFHDDSLHPKTDVATKFPHRKPWTFTTFTLEEIRSLDAGSWFIKNDPFGQINANSLTKKEIDAYRKEKIPTVKEALTFTAEKNIIINLELKALPSPMENFPLVEKVIHTIAESLISTDKIFLSSFNHKWLHDVQKLAPKISVGALIGYPPSETLSQGAMDFTTYIIRSDLLNEKIINEKREAGIKIIPYTVNSADEMQRFIHAGVAGIVTDFPQLLSGLL